MVSFTLRTGLCRPKQPTGGRAEKAKGQKFGSGDYRPEYAGDGWDAR